MRKRDGYLPVLVIFFALVLVTALVWDASSPGRGTALQASSEGDGEEELDRSVFPKDKVVDVKITIDEEDFEDMLANASAEEMKPASVEYNGIKLDNVGIRTKGNLSLRSVVSSDSDRYSFKLSFDEYISSQTLQGISKINLNNNYSDATYMREFLTYELAEEMGLPTPKFSYVNVYVNGELWGFYLAIEQVGDAYLERNFGNAYGALYKAEFGGGMGGGFPGGGAAGGGFPGGNAAGGGFPGGNAEGGRVSGENAETGGAPGGEVGGDAGAGGAAAAGRGSGGGDLVWQGDDLDSYSSLVQKSKSSNGDILIEMLDELNNGSDYEKVLDVEGALKYIALNAVTVNMDSYLGSNQQNYYLYEDEGVFSVLPWDYNMAFGGMGGESEQIMIDEPTQGALAERPLAAKLLAVEEYKEKYHEIIQGMVDGYLADETFAARVKQIQELISPYVKQDPRPFYTYEQYESAVPQLVSFTQGRVANVSGQLDGTIASSGDGSGSGGGFGGRGGGRGDRPAAVQSDQAAAGQNGQPQDVAQTPNGQAPDGQAPDGAQAPNGEASGGAQTPDGQAPDEQAPDGAQAPNGEASGGAQTPDGQAPEGMQPPDGGAFPGGQGGVTPGQGGFGRGQGGFGGIPGMDGGASSTSAQSGSYENAATTGAALAILLLAGLFVAYYKRKRL